MEIQILFEDEHLVVINKPAGVTVTPGPGHPFENTIAGWLLDRVGEQLKDVGQEDRWGIVHRLDKDTSGVMIMAKSITMFEHLVNQFRNREVKKEYLALVWGDVGATIERKTRNKGHRKAELNDSSFIVPRAKFVINAPIDRHPGGFSRFIVSQDGKPAVTEFEIVGKAELRRQKAEGRKQNSEFSLLKAYPQTGRTHQIRVHLKAFGHPVVGDMAYQTKAQQKLSKDFLDRQFLHASTITVSMLDGGERSFEAPLAEELSSVVQVSEQSEHIQNQQI